MCNFIFIKVRAGAKNIISTLWPVDDEITQRFMSEFYSNLINKKSLTCLLEIQN
jgi:CHAT domain-containing protein